MKKLLSVFLSIAVLIIAQVNSFSQEQDSLIQLYPGIGDTIYFFDREYFELFQQIDGFEYAVLYIRDNKELISKVTFKSESMFHDTFFIQNLSVLENVRSTIKKIDAENNKNLNSPSDVIILTKDENKYKGLLEMFSEENLYLLSNEHPDYRYKVPVSRVDKIIISGESKALSTMGWGALIGLGIGVAIGLAAADGEGFISPGATVAAAGVGFSLIGAILGLIAGLAGSESDQEIQIDKDNDILQLKSIAYYYFIYDEGIENDYAEIK